MHYPSRSKLNKKLLISDLFGIFILPTSTGLVVEAFQGNRSALVAQSASESVDLGEATIASIHAGFDSGDLTCTQIVSYYLDQIEAFDGVVNSLLYVNSKALEVAAQLDTQYESSGPVGPLHCIPVIAKDNYDTADMPTTAGWVGLRDSIPLNDAYTIKRLREAGAVILAKSNLTEFARGGTTVSSLGGQTLNPYDLTRTPGGSTGGGGAAIALNFGVLATASDTGQSTRSPASANNLVGIRSTYGLVSRHGIVPVSFTQDNTGQIARTVRDAAIMLDVMAGYDPGDPSTAFSLGRIPSSYTDELDVNGLQGARIGVLEDFFGTEDIHSEVNAVTIAAADKMAEIGAEIIPVTIPNLSALTANLQVGDIEFKTALNAYLASREPDIPVKSFDDVMQMGGFDPAIVSSMQTSAEFADLSSNQDYKDRLLRRNDLRRAVMKVMAENNLDAILYPHQKRLVVPVGEDQVERNGVLSNSTGFPAVTFQGGFSSPTETAPIGVPVGIELLGPEWSEAKLLKYAYAFEQATDHRQPPVMDLTQAALQTLDVAIEDEISTSRQDGLLQALKDLTQGNRI
ncbi:amidase [Phormidium sp. FACHB-1136]|nr:amidase [Phormidium sp. FACHB-1136]